MNHREGLDPQEIKEYQEMLKEWRFHEHGASPFIDGTVEWKMWNERFAFLRKKAFPDQLVAASKVVGWTHA